MNATRDHAAPSWLSWLTRAGRVAAVCSLWLVASAGEGKAQVVGGTVTDSTTGQPVSGGFVVLLAEGGVEVVRTLTARDGSFVLTAPQPGRYRLRSERIAFRSFTTAPFDLPRGTQVAYQLRVRALPARLKTIEVTGETECVVRPEDGFQVATLWEEARKALSATAWTAEQGLFQYAVERHTSNLDRGLDVEDATVDTIIVSAAQPFATESPEVLVELGYIRREDDWWVYDGIDARVFLSDPFLDTHCFRIRPSPEADGTVGLAFELVESREVSDVEGVLWLDEQTAELRVLEFTYTSPPFRLRADRMGGRVEFLRLSGGHWIVQEWWIRTPVFSFRRLRLRLAGYTEHGAAVLEVLRVQDPPHR